MSRRLTLLAAWVVVCKTMIAAEVGVAGREARVHVGPGSIAAGRAHSVMATPDGRVLAWGAGRRGQLGNGRLVDRATPTEVPGLPGVIAVSAGAAHTVALSADGEVFAWGANSFGRLGDGTFRRRVRPVRVAGLTRVRMIAAGRAHTLALTDDGRVYGWGLNIGGQLGIGKRSPAIRPTLVPGLANIVWIAAGDEHSLAVTTDGRVYAWGRNQFSVLGDGTTRDRPRPVVIGLTDVVQVAAGAAHSLALTRSGGVYSWGRGADGELGTGSTRPASTPRLVDGVTAKAIAAGRHFSAALQRSGEPLLWGANDSGQLGDGTTSRRLRPTAISGLEPVLNIALGSVHAVAVSVGGQVRAWGEGQSGRLGSGTVLDQSSPVEVMPDLPDWGVEPGDEGPPSPPAIAPVTGIYPAPQLVTITANQIGDVVRFTLDGAEPDDRSPVYAGSFVVTRTTTVRARSFGGAGLSSDVRAETFTIDTTPPSISVATSPPVHPGWMSSPVTVSFQCDDNVGIAICPSAVVVDSDAHARPVSGTAIDLAGHSSAIAIVLNVDVSPPVVAIDLPEPGLTVDADAVVVSARVADTGSGLADAECNGVTAPVVDGVLTCTVALRPGRNDIVLHAVDRVGHAASGSVSIQRAGTARGLTLTPAARAMVVAEEVRLSLRDEAGVVVPGAAWSLRDEGVLVMSADDPPVVTAIAPGETLVRAEKDGVAVEAAITVRAALAPGEIRWQLPGIDGLSPALPIFANRVGVDVPQLFAIDSPGWGEATVRAVSVDGDLLWQQSVAGIPLMGDTFGGLVVGELYDINQGDDFRAYVRIGDGSARPWRFRSMGGLLRPAQSSDGTIYAIEYILGFAQNGDEVWDKYVVLIDGSSGRLIRRTLLPRETHQFTSERHGDVLSGPNPVQCLSWREESAPATLGPVVGADGRGYVLVRRYAQQSQASCRRFAFAARSLEIGFDLMAFSPAADLEVVPVYSAACVAAEGVKSICDLELRLEQLVPDGIGGTMVGYWRPTEVVNDRITGKRFLSRVTPDKAVVHLPEAHRVEVMGQAGTAFTRANGVVAFDVVTGDVKWRHDSAVATPLAARPDNGAALVDWSTGNLQVVDGAGVLAVEQPLGIDWPPVNQSGDWIGLRGSQLTAVVGEFPDATRFNTSDGNTNQKNVRRPGVGLFAKTHLAIDLLGMVRYRHVSIRVVPTNWQEWIERGIELRGTDEFGNGYFTLGAGSDSADTNLLCSGSLVSDLNRSSDYLTPPYDPVEKLAYPPALENAMIQSLLDRDAAYDDRLPYACRPEQNPGFYNSNSYAHGLLNAVGLPKPRFPQRWPALVPGWMKPVPTAKFQ